MDARVKPGHDSAGMTIAMSSPRLILVTGATGKVGQTFMRRLLGDPAHAGDRIRALCHNRVLPATDRVEVVRGSIAERAVAERAVAGVTHVLHLATCKETPEDVMDVTVKGLFWLLEACRQSPTFKQFILIGGDAGIGHFFYRAPRSRSPRRIRHSAYPGCYALSKVLEEVMLEQYYIQYDLGGCCLRAPWIMEKDDFKYTQSFGDDVFGGPRWIDLVGKDRAAEYRKTGAVPLMLDTDGAPMRRNFVHVEDLVEAIVTALDHPASAPADLQHLHGRAGRLRRGRGAPEENPRPAERRDRDALSQHLARQREGQVPAGLAAAL